MHAEGSGSMQRRVLCWKATPVCALQEGVLPTEPGLLRTEGGRVQAYTGIRVHRQKASCKTRSIKCLLSGSAVDRDQEAKMRLK